MRSRTCVTGAVRTRNDGVVAAIEERPAFDLGEDQALDADEEDEGGDAKDKVPERTSGVPSSSQI
jgi:hypothetical protein